MFRRLAEAGVDFVVIGGIALVAHGSARLTRDLDIVFGPDEANLERLGRVLVELGARLRGVDENVPFVPDAATLAKVDLLTLDTPLGWLDIHRRPAGAPPYRTLRRRAERVNFGDFSVFVASPEDLQAMKRRAGRPIDIVDLDYLDAIIRLRGRS
jgi:Nucleotidyl transferase AbiEii toxin, Type IV TA system